MEFIVLILVAVICFVVVYLITPKKVITKDKLESFAQNSNFIEIYSDFGVGLSITNGEDDYNQGLSELGYTTYESLIAFFSKYGFVIREKNEINHRCYLQKQEQPIHKDKDIEYYYNLYQKGIITESEYNTKKQELL